MRLCRERGVAFHVDAAQSAGKLPIDVEAMNVDLLSLTAHKIYGPKGVGALYVRRKPPLGLRPLIYGGGQESGLRSGTLATHQIVGMGLAFEIAAARARSRTSSASRALRDRLWAGISRARRRRAERASASERVAGVLNVSFHGIEGESLQFALRELAVSAGAACSSASEEASYVLRALGRSDQLAQSSLRFSLGPIHDGGGDRNRDRRSEARSRRGCGRWRPGVNSQRTSLKTSLDTVRWSSSTSSGRATPGASPPAPT